MTESAPIDQRHLALDTPEFRKLCDEYGRTAASATQGVERYAAILQHVQGLIDDAVLKASLKLLEAAAPPPFKRDFRSRGDAAFLERGKDPLIEQPD